MVNNKIPVWLLVLLPILGFNEIMLVLSSPLLFMLLLFLGGGSVALYAISPALLLTVTRAFTDAAAGAGLDFVRKLVPGQAAER